MGRVAARVQFESVTGILRDRTVQDFEFRWDGPTGPTDGELGELADKLDDFYNTASGGMTAALYGYMSGEVSRVADAHKIVLYRVDDITDPLGSPDLVRSFSIGAYSGTAYSLPAEVAAVLSYNADLTDVPETSGDTRPAARRRGRVYFGPLNWIVLGLGAGEAGVQRPDAEFQSNLREAALKLQADAANIMGLGAGLFWSVYSAADVALRNIVRFCTDDAFDTQRRRGADPTGKVCEDVP